MCSQQQNFVGKLRGRTRRLFFYSIYVCVCLFVYALGRMWLRALSTRESERCSYSPSLIQGPGRGVRGRACYRGLGPITALHLIALPTPPEGSPGNGRVQGVPEINERHRAVNSGDRLALCLRPPDMFGQLLTSHLSHPPRSPRDPYSHSVSAKALRAPIRWSQVSERARILYKAAPLIHKTPLPVPQATRSSGHSDTNTTTLHVEYKIKNKIIYEG